VFSTRIRRGLTLPLFEDGLESRDFVHVSDVVNAFMAALRAPVAIDGVVNVGSGQAVTVITAARELSFAFGVAPLIEVTGEYRLGDIRHNRADISRLREQLGVVPAVPFAVGVRRLARWAGTQPLGEDRLPLASAELRKRRLMG
jgi:dTDP-L-rhamnose 4-epimerase